MNIQDENPIIEAHDLTVTYNKKPALWSVDFLLPKHKLIGIIGPNGAGKSTLIKAIMGIVPLASGYVKLFNKDLDEVRNKISYVPQRGSVDWDFPASVLDIVLMGRYNRGKLLKRITKEDKQIALNCLDKVQMLPFVNRQIGQLSGGQQQRVFIARALAQNADLYLLDEPFAGIDAASEDAIFRLLQDIRSEGKSILVVHHDLQSAARFFDWIILLNTRLVAVGPKEKVFSKNLLNETYGGKLTLLSDLGNLMQQKEFPAREKKNG